jgi:hypothetical protein
MPLHRGRVNLLGAFKNRLHRKFGDASEPEEQQGMCILPWLSFDGELEMGDVTIAGWNRARRTLPSAVVETADHILSAFRDVRGNAVDASLCWFSERGPTSALDEEDVEILRDYVQLAALAGIASNQYLSHRDQVNATHFARIYQNFLPGAETLALVRRRRDGSITSAGWRIDELRFTAPAAAAQRPSPRFADAFTTALATCVGADDEASTRIRQSLTLFLQGSELDEYETHAQEVVWLASALEQLCGVEGRYKDRQIADKLVDALGATWTDEGKRAIRRWMTEFYAKRSEIHGGSASTSHWPNWAHALLGTVAYVALVKQLLATEGRYALTDADEDDAAALPHRVGCLRDADEQSQDDFARCWRSGAVWEGAMARIFTRLGLR